MYGSVSLLFAQVLRRFQTVEKNIFLKFRKPKNGAKVYERYPSGIWIYVCFHCFPNDGKYWGEMIIYLLFLRYLPTMHEFINCIICFIELKNGEKLDSNNLM